MQRSNVPRPSPVATRSRRRADHHALVAGQVAAHRRPAQTGRAHQLHHGLGLLGSISSASSGSGPDRRRPLRSAAGPDPGRRRRRTGPAAARATRSRAPARLRRGRRAGWPAPRPSDPPSSRSAWPNETGSPSRSALPEPRPARPDRRPGRARTRSGRSSASASATAPLPVPTSTTDAPAGSARPTSTSSSVSGRGISTRESTCRVSRRNIPPSQDVGHRLTVGAARPPGPRSGPGRRRQRLVAGRSRGAPGPPPAPRPAAALHPGAA